MPLCAIAYVSRARTDLSPTDLDGLLADATTFNRMAGITSVLMFDGERFLQYLEGPADGLASVHARIVNATRHSDIRELASGPIAARRFPCWTMATRQVERAVLAGLADASWHGFDSGTAVAGNGFGMLLCSWTDGRGELQPAAVSLGS